jgi:signal transduction histidine kinase
MVSHELRTPLHQYLHTPIYSKETAQATSLKKQVRQLGAVRRNSTHLSRLISDLLDISKIENSEFTLSKAEFDLSEIIVELVESLEPLAAAKEQRITAFIDEDIEMVGDRQKLTQVVSNLIENAIKYSPEDADINIETSVIDGEAKVAIRDNGYGITKSDQEQIFEAFFRSRTEENWEVPGTGLGLALVKRIISMHGGSVDLDSEIGVGSVFTILLPVLTATGADEPVPESVQPETMSEEDIIEGNIRARRSAMAKQKQQKIESEEAA